MQEALRVWALVWPLVWALGARAGAPRMGCRQQHCKLLSADGHGWFKYEVEGNVILITLREYTLDVDCSDVASLDSPALPAFSSKLRVSRVKLWTCPLPARALAAVLTALNVTLACEPAGPGACGELSLAFFPPAPPLTATHLTGLEHLALLELYGVPVAFPRLERGFLVPLQKLLSLTIWDVVLPGGELDSPPPTLQNLSLNNVDGLERLPEAPILESLEVTNWARSLEPLARCAELRKLHMETLWVTTLPAGWLAACSLLEDLIIFRASLTTLPPELLLNNGALGRLSLEQTALETLPPGLLDNSPNLHTLQLGSNRLRRLPSNLFGVARRVRELDLYGNELDSGVMVALAPLHELSELNLADNSRLGDVCGSDGFSLIRNSTKLTKLDLSGTSVSRICRDWRTDMTLLQTLDLTDTKLVELSFEDLQFTRSKVIEVVLRNTPAFLKMSREEYIHAARALPSSARVLLESDKSQLACNCSVYWMRRALDLSLPALRHVGELNCSDGRRLQDVPPEQLVCARPEECKVAALPRACSCDGRPDDDPSQARRLVRVRCEAAALTRVPRLSAARGRLYELQLAHNNITHLHAGDLPHYITGLDLRNNSLREVDEVTARRLRDIVGMLRLAGNPLECSCRAAPLLRVLLDRDAVWTDVVDASCSDGRPLLSVVNMKCLRSAQPAAALAAWLAGALGVLLAAVLATTACLGSRERRFFARAVLHRWGCVWRAADPDEDDGSRYDAFVTFSHKDSAAALELVARLEPPYRLCVHYRDWVPGRLIPEQIVESVRDSRCTVALVSRHFLTSTWARAEFREAHAAAMQDARLRLVLLLLEEPAALQLDEQLRRYVATHTYLRWGEPYFWDKLAVALPRPRAPRAQPPPAPRAQPPPAPPAEPPALALQLLPASPSLITDTAAVASPSSLLEIRTQSKAPDQFK